MKAILNTGSTIKQGIASKGGKKLSAEYMEAAAICHMNSADWEAMGRPGKVRVKTSAGKVEVYAREDDSLMEGAIFIPRGPWANSVVSCETYSTGSPSYKGMEAEVEATEDEVKAIDDLLGIKGR